MSADQVIEIAAERTQCPYCGRSVRVDNNGLIRTHATEAGARNNTCPMAGEHVPITGHSDVDYIARAHLVSKLAWRIKDEDPQRVWNYLTVLPSEGGERLYRIKTIAEVFERVARESELRSTNTPA